MRSCVSGWCALVASAAAFIAALVLTSSSLPPVVATHFNGAGVADGFMKSSAHVLSMGGLGLAGALFSLGIFYSLRFFPPGLMNLPDKDYWLAPERKAETHARFLNAGVWLATIELLFVMALYLLTVAANRVTPPRMPSQVWTITGVFAVMVVGWMIWLYRGFQKPVGR